jgi:hypothetical protein
LGQVDESVAYLGLVAGRTNLNDVNVNLLECFPISHMQQLHIELIGPSTCKEGAKSNLLKMILVYTVLLEMGVEAAVLIGAFKPEVDDDDDDDDYYYDYDGGGGGGGGGGDDDDDGGGGDDDDDDDDDDGYYYY